MPHDDLQSPKWQLRILDGPLRGATHPLRERTTIGRATGSDLQLIDTGVSREHAIIVRDEFDNYVLIDLSSANGTTIAGARVERAVLRPHTVFRVVDTEIAFEPTEVPYAFGTNAPVLVSGEIGQVTEYRELEPERVGAPAPPAPAPAEVLAGEGEHPVSFEGPDGSELGGLLIDDILQYRRLRAQCLRGGLATPAQLRHFHALQDRLQQPPARTTASRRAFCRFACWFPATLRFASRDDVPCWIRDLGADGAQLKVEGPPIQRNCITWLALEFTVDGHPRTEILAARVAWTDGDFMGLAFMGPPRSENGRYAAGPAVREVVENTRPRPEATLMRVANGDE